MNKEYYEAKANLCRDLFIKQVADNNTKEAGANLMRMVNALTQIEMLKIKETKDKCEECGFYTWDADSAPLEDCKTCGRERVEV